MKDKKAKVPSPLPNKPSLPIPLAAPDNIPGFLNPEANRRQHTLDHVQASKTPEPLPIVSAATAATGLDADKGKPPLTDLQRHLLAVGKPSAVSLAAHGGHDRRDDGAATNERKRKKTSAMSVSDFLAQGEGVSLPRSKDYRKNKEKQKRARAQSSVHGWKSEAEMVLRQQYDS